MLQQSKIICKKFAQNIKSIKFEAINHEIEDKEKPIAQQLELIFEGLKVGLSSRISPLIHL